MSNGLDTPQPARRGRSTLAGWGAMPLGKRPNGDASRRTMETATQSGILDRGAAGGLRSIETDFFQHRSVCFRRLANLQASTPSTTLEGYSRAAADMLEDGLASLDPIDHARGLLEGCAES